MTENDPVQPLCLETTRLTANNGPVYDSTTIRGSEPSVSPSETSTRSSPGLIGLPTDSLDKNLPGETDSYNGPSRRRKATLVCLLSLALLTLHLCFLPRTSLSRDLRRWHGARIPTATVNRKFLEYTFGSPHTSNHSCEQNMFLRMSNFTSLNKQHPTNMAADKNSPRIDFIKSSMAHLGFDTRIHSHEHESPLRPLSLNVTLVDSKSSQPIRYIPLLEPGYETPAFVAHGINGTVNASYIYANTGRDQDYRSLKSNGFDMNGKIVIVKLEAIRDLSYIISVAELHGAVGLLYFFTGGYDLSKNTTKHQEQSVARGNAGRGPMTNYMIPRLLSIPLSLSSARSLLSKVSQDDPNCFAGWDFAPLPSEGNIFLSMAATFASPPTQHLTNVIATLPGSTSEGTIIIAAKHDSLTASDPMSGLSIMLEIMSAFQGLVSEGWKPLRTIKFISWDGSCSGSLGSQLEVSASSGNVENVLAYINIDGDAITGLKLHIDSSPLLNQIIRESSKNVPMQLGSRLDLLAHKRDSVAIANSVRKSGQQTLQQYWSEQDNCTINNDLGDVLGTSNVGIFQSHLSIPSINFRFDNDASRDASIHIPNSNAYSLEWLTESNVDPDLTLHGSAVRYLGLLTISLSEREIPNYHILEYANYINTSFHQVSTLHSNTLKSWEGNRVPADLISKSALSNYIKCDHPSRNCTFSDLMSQTLVLLNDLIEKSRLADQKNAQIQLSLYDDYAWYRFWHKWANYMHFKLATKRLAHLERVFALGPRDFETLEIPQEYFNHLIYGAADQIHEGKRTQFSGLQEAILEDKYALTARWIIIIYNKLSAFNDIII